MRHLTLRWAVRAVAALALLGGMFTGLIAFAGSAGATNNNPTGNPTSPAVSYEADCVGTGSATGEVAPFISSTVIDTTTTTAKPRGTTFGVSGVVSQDLSGAFVAGLVQGLQTATGGFKSTITLKVAETFGSTDGHASGTYAYTHQFGKEAMTAGAKKVTYAAGATTLTVAGYEGSAPKVDDLVSGKGITAGTAIRAVTGTTITLSAATTTAETTKSVAWATHAGVLFTTAAFSSGSVFTTNGTARTTTAGIGITSVKEFVIGGEIVTLTFGGTAGKGAATCLETGYTAAGVAGPGQTKAGTKPLYPAGTTTPLVSVAPLTFQSGAYVNMVVSAPTAHSASINLGVGQSKTVTLSTTPGTATYPVTACTLGTVTGTLSVTISNSPTVCEATVTSTGTVASTASFTFTATTGVKTSTAATVTVTIGTPPVDQPLAQTVTAGQLVLSCNAPGSTGYPLLTCPLVTLPTITLNGVTQTVTAPASTIYVSDNRGTPAAGWTLTTYMVPTTSTNGQSNTTCSTYVGFCDSSVGTSAANANGKIAPKYLAISAPTCTPATGNLSPAPTAGTGGKYTATQTLCTAAAGTSGGTFSMNAAFSLTIPASSYAGVYYGTVEYLVS